LVERKLMISRVHIIAEGLVQGVGFRWFVARRAEALGVRGYIRNLYDGSVELEAEGDRSLLEEFMKEVRVGPRSAHVRNVRIEWRDPVNRESIFEIR
jgi:acylphosphatase